MSFVFEVHAAAVETVAANTNPKTDEVRQREVLKADRVDIDANFPSEALGDLDGVRRVALAIATQRADALRAIKARLLAGEHAEALRLMYDFFGLPLDSDVAAENRS